MAARRDAHKDASDVALEFADFMRRFTQKERIEDLKSTLDEFGQFFSDPEFVATLKLLNKMKEGGGIKPSNQEPEPFKVHPVYWEKHDKKPAKGKKGPREKYWTADWEGMALRVDWLKTSEVIFCGCIDGEVVCKEKTLSIAQQRVTAEAIRRLETAR